MSDRFDNFLVSYHAPSRLIEVDSALGGSMGRNVSLDGGGGGSLVARGGLFRMGAEIPASSELIVACVGGFSPRGVASSQFWRRSGTRM